MANTSCPSGSFNLSCCRHSPTPHSHFPISFTGATGTASACWSSGWPGRRRQIALCRVPFQLATQTHGDVAQMTDGRRTMADFDVANWPLAAGDAVEPVLVMVLAHVQSRVAAGELGLYNSGLLAMRLPRSTNTQPSVPVNSTPLLCPSCSTLSYPAECLRPHCLEWQFSSTPLAYVYFTSNSWATSCGPWIKVLTDARNLHRAAAVGADTPLGDVVVMRAPVGHLAAGIIGEPAELVMAPVGAIVRIRRRAEPEVPIQLRPAAWSAAARCPGRRGRCAYRRAPACRSCCCAPVRKPSGSGVGPLLAAGLEDRAVAPGGVDHLAVLRQSSASAASRNRRPCRPPWRRWPSERANGRARRSARRRYRCRSHRSRKSLKIAACGRFGKDVCAAWSR